MGTALGAALVTVVRATAARVPRRHRIAPTKNPASAWQLVTAIGVILGVLTPFVAVAAINGGNRLGVVYYGHLRPAAVQVPGSIASYGSGAKLYRAKPAEPPETVVSRMRARLAIKGNCANEQGTWICDGSRLTKLFVYPYSTWAADFAYGSRHRDDGAPRIDEAAGRKAARSHFTAFGIAPGGLRYVGVSDRWKDGYLHLDYEGREQGGDAFLWGKVSVTLGENGKLVAIEDLRIPVTAVQPVETISPRAAIGIAQDVGVDSVPGTASIHDVTASYYFDENSGYLVPVWRIEGSLTREGGDISEWNASIDARSHC